ncbi:hypothetical protein WJX72_000785 [[Myrmecia] bisecta]|uniref:Uncharacterized protein n=1 Tax=[Myrmecia] bisecta TaxID=41462 RepID=A0AAW1Q838_9CHLO
MGGSLSRPEEQYSSNDVELVIRASKDLEHLLDTEFGASGKGLHEKITSCGRQLPDDLIKKMRYLATIRNKLIHEHGVNSIPNRDGFIRSFQESQDVQSLSVWSLLLPSALGHQPELTQNSR